MECTIGGTRKHLVDVASLQRASGLDVEVVASSLRQPEFEGDLRALETRGVRVHRMPMVRSIRPATDARQCLALARLLESARPDVVHTHSSKAGVLGRLASSTVEIGARVHTPHTFAFLFGAMFGAVQRRMYFEIERGLAARTQALVAVSESERATIVASGVAPLERVRCVPNGIDPAPFLNARPLERRELCADPSKPLVLVVGLLNAAKGQDLALEALASRGLEDVQLVLAGHGEMRAELEALAQRLRVAPRVRFLGFRDDVPRLLATCDALLLPSRWEGMPYAVLEAMASAKPVVATPVDGARDAVVDGRTGFVAHAIDAASITEALRRCVHSSALERAELGRAGRARLLELYSARAMVDGLVRVYTEVA